MKNILFANTNNNCINRLSKRSFLSNRRRNLFITLALVLTSFMITAIFNISFSYIETYQLQQNRLMGTTADVAITNPNDKQIAELSRSSLVDIVGILQRLGSVDTTQLKDTSLGLVWINEEEWNMHRVPTISNIQGDYPEKESEVMLPTWVLEAMGITKPELGMKVSISYELNDGDKVNNETFILSGYYTDYMATRTNNKGYVYVSKEFRDATNLSLTNESSAMITFKDTNDVEKSCEKLRDKIDFTNEQKFEVVPRSEANSNNIFMVAGLVIIFIMVSSYLLIYNIFYISVSKDTRFYGQLKAIGTTKKQIRKIIRKQVLKLSAIGIPIGLALGAITSFGIVPFAMNMLYPNSTDTVEISFSPLLFLGAAIFTLLTAVISSMKPAKLASSIPPIVALRYVDVIEKKKGVKKFHRFKISRLAFDNIFRSKKSALLVFCSLFLGLSLFLVTSGIFSSLSPENFASQWGESDFALTYSIHEERNLITKEMAKEIQNIEGVENFRITNVASPKITMDVIYNDDVFGDYIDSLKGKAGIDFSTQDKINQYTENFYSGVYAIDSTYIEEINKTADNPIDISKFERGEIVVLTQNLDSNGQEIVPPNSKITVKSNDKSSSFTVGTVYLDEDFQSGRGNESGTAPDLYISKNALKQLSPESKIFRIEFDTNGKQDEYILQQLKEITNSSDDIIITSRLEKIQEMEGYFITTRVLGIGLSIVLMLIGVMNFINTMIVNVHNRKHELAVLESIGMTKSQLKQMLIYEGLYYWGISFILLATIGTAIYGLLYEFFQQLVPYAVFSYPFLDVIFVEITVLIVCLVVPNIVYNLDDKVSIVERLRYKE